MNNDKFTAHDFLWLTLNLQYIDLIKSNYDYMIFYYFHFSFFITGQIFLNKKISHHT